MGLGTPLEAQGMPQRLTCKAVFQTERWGEEPVEYWGPEGTEGYGPGPLGRKGRTLLGQGGDEPGEGRDRAVGQADCKPEQKLFVSYQKSPSLSRVKVRKSIPFGFQLAGCGDRGGSPPRDGSLEIPSCCFNGSPGFRSG